MIRLVLYRSRANSVLILQLVSSFNSKICLEKSKFLDRLDDLLKLFGTKDQCQKPLGDKITTKPSRIVKHHSAVPSLNSCPTITRFCVCTVCMRLVDHVENLGTREARRSKKVLRSHCDSRCRSSSNNNSSSCYCCCCCCRCCSCCCWRCWCWGP